MEVDTTVALSATRAWHPRDLRSCRALLAQSLSGPGLVAHAEGAARHLSAGAGLAEDGVVAFFGQLLLDFRSQTEVS